MGGCIIDYLSYDFCFTKEVLYSIPVGLQFVIKKFTSVLPLSLFILAFCVFIGTLLDYGKYYLVDVGLWRPTIHCENSTQDLGDILTGEAPVCVFLIKNTGTAELKIIKVNPGCASCVKVIKYPQNPIPNGVTEKITLKLLTKDLKDSVEKQVAVKSNDPLKPWLTLTIKANVRGPVVVDK